ncbi:O-antigen ligase family protein [Desulfobacterales bacterium HSG2]|nr:O-antigen ligase family protein [Desulfobacterales bacterium HSG2]
MKTFEAEKTDPIHSLKFEKIGLVIVTISLFLSPFIVFLALPPFHIGVWFQSEPVIAGLHGVSALTTSGLLILLLANARRYSQVVRHPLILVSAALGIWSILISWFADVPVLSWLGDPRHGEGAVWYLDMASLFAGGMILRGNQRLRRSLGWICLTAALTVTALTVYGSRNPGWPWSPYWFSDHLGFYGIFTALILMTNIQPNSVFGRVACLMAGSGIVLISSNRAAILLCLTLAPAVWGALHYLRRNMKKRVRVYAAAMVIAVPIILTAGVTLYGMHLSSTHPKGWIRSDSSLSSRYLQNRVILLSLQDKPSALITGHGWGHYADHLLAHANQESVFLGAEDRNRPDSLEREYFHSHNGFAEAILSAGMIGLALMWGILLALPCWCEDSRIPLAGTAAALMAGLSAVWFQLPGSVPFMALAWAGFCQPTPNPVRERRMASAGVILFFVLTFLIFLIQMYALGLTWHQGVRIRDTLARASRTAGVKVKVRDLTACSGPGGIHFTRIFLKTAAQARENPSGFANDTPPLLFTFLEAHERMLSGGKKMSLRFHSSGLLVRGELAFSLTHPVFARNAPAYLADWEEMLGSFLRRAPRRTDMAALYLLWLLREGEEQKMLRFANRILDREAADPVGLWFSGLALAAEPGKRYDGLKRLKQSIELGIERIIPVDPGIREQIRAR